MTQARGLPSLKSGSSYLAVCLALIPWLAAASAPLLEVHLGNGEMFFREKKAKQSHTPLSPPSCLDLSCHAFCSDSSLKKKTCRLFSFLSVCLNQVTKPGYPSAWSTSSSTSPIPAQSRGTQCPPGTSAGPWPQPSLVFVLVTSLLERPRACVHSSHTPHGSVADLTRVCLFRSHTPWGPCCPRTGHGEGLRVGERKC